MMKPPTHTHVSSNVDMHNLILHHVHMLIHSIIGQGVSFINVVRTRNPLEYELILVVSSTWVFFGMDGGKYLITQGPSPHWSRFYLLLDDDVLFHSSSLMMIFLLNNLCANYDITTHKIYVPHDTFSQLTIWMFLMKWVYLRYAWWTPRIKLSMTNKMKRREVE